MFLVRDLVSPRTWLAMTSHLAGLVIGFAVIFVFTFGLGFGFSLVVIALVGLPVLGVTLRFAEWFATAERARLGLMLGVRIPAWPAEARAGYRWGIVPRWRMFTERATWSEIGYGLLRLPVSAVAATVSVAAWAAGLVMLTLPLYNSSLPSGGAKIGDFVLRRHAQDDGLGGDRPAGAAGCGAADPRAGGRGRGDVPPCCSARAATWPPG